MTGCILYAPVFDRVEVGPFGSEVRIELLQRGLRVAKLQGPNGILPLLSKKSAERSFNKRNCWANWRCETFAAFNLLQRRTKVLLDSVGLDYDRESDERSTELSAGGAQTSK